MPYIILLYVAMHLGIVFATKETPKSKLKKSAWIKFSSLILY